jgi:hypothetical protein
MIAGGAHAANLLVNGSFETGDFTGWNTANLNATGVVGSGFDGWPAEDGNDFVAMGNVGSDGEIAQTFADTAGQSLTVSFYQGSDGATPNDFSAYFDGVLLTSQVNAPDQRPNYTFYSFTVTGTGSDTIAFFERNDPAYGALDNVSVTGVPEPAAWAMMLVGFGLAGAALRRRVVAA